MPSSTSGGDKRTLYDEAADDGVINVLDSELVAFRNELHYRLEKPELYQIHVPTLEHHIVDSSIRRLEKAGKLESTGLRGRKPSGAKYTHIFYKKVEASYGRLPEIMKAKVDLSRFIFGLSSYAGFYAQNLWLKAFGEIGFNILDENTGEFEGKKASVSGDIDFIVEKDDVRFGVEVKNGFSYASDIRNKFRIAAELGVIPFLVVRRLPYGIRKWITSNGGLILPYNDGIYPFDCEAKTRECINRLGFPIIMLKNVDDRFKDKILYIFRLAYARKEFLRKKLDKYLQVVKSVS